MVNVADVCYVYGISRCLFELVIGQWRRRKKLLQDSDAVPRGGGGSRGRHGQAGGQRRRADFAPPQLLRRRHETTAPVPTTPPAAAAVTPRPGVTGVTAWVTQNATAEAATGGDGAHDDSDDMLMILLPSNGTLITSSADDISERGI